MLLVRDDQAGSEEERVRGLRTGSSRGFSDLCAGRYRPWSSASAGKRRIGDSIDVTMTSDLTSIEAILTRMVLDEA